MKHLIVFLLAIFSFTTTYSQSGTGSIRGTITDAETGEPIPFANVALQDSSQAILMGTTTDFDGKYTLKPIKAGVYNVEVNYIGCQAQLIKGVVVSDQKITFTDVQLKKGLSIDEIVIVEYKRPLIRRDKIRSKRNSRAKLNSMSVRTPSDIAKIAGNGTFSRDDGSGRINSRGSRARNQVIIVDGVKLSSYSKSDNSGESYNEFADNLFESPTNTPLSTFSIDVDKASYANTRRYLNDGSLPPRNAVRIEEMINYFNYEYPQPTAEHPFSITTEYADCPWNPKRKLALIGIQGEKIEMKEAPKSNLVFLIDVSGSMDYPDKLGLLVSGLELLVDQLRREDRIAIVVYAGAAGEVLSSTPGDQKIKIKEVLNRLQAGGSTAGGAGIELAYNIAEKHFVKDGINRVILASDGDFNVGVSDTESLVKLIEKKRETGIFLSVLGFGTGNYQDDKMEQMADKGNGNYNYIDNLREAKKVLVKEMGGTLVTIAKDVKVQAEFNPAVVKAYRLVGYVNRHLEDEDFNNDKIDAGELGSGHSVTVLYEIIPADSDEAINDIDPLKYQKQIKKNAKEYTDEVLTVKFRYKKPDESKSVLLTEVLENKPISIELASDNLRFSASVASFGMVLRGSESAKDLKFEEIMQLAKKAKGEDAEGYRAEFIQLVEMAELIR